MNRPIWRNTICMQKPMFQIKEAKSDELQHEKMYFWTCVRRTQISLGMHAAWSVFYKALQTSNVSKEV